MPKDFARTQRVADQIQRELSDIIRTELKDPRVGLVTITDVDVTQDYSHAKIFFTLMGDTALAPQSQLGLERAAGFLRSQLAHRMMLRTVPQLHFVYDTSVERGVHLSHLIDVAVAEDKAHLDDDES
ncbi:30S ribosome-binding factor RbfA [Sulfurirhabdus autotrophica]|uniref:Ribosome-binding factor A n=1 Tax=Sulfurirhabdus autotrophica TaxID=1706046 RepID=A0A4R3YFV8_9PROT|nr:30S ribosome-binding factor RbfA [Sulfurirhabdus autotrophica]TCV90881.1 ribosome-binding factor A [Sulfurirhabdus autotrophica]